MRVYSTRGRAPAAGLAEAIAAGLAPDGGLYLPEAWPRLDAAAFAADADLPAVATRLLAPLFAGDALAPALPGICARAFAVPAPLCPFGADGDFLLELFHGPTAAFKDYGASFLAGCLTALPRTPAGRPLTIVVATSGDTGAAVGAAFHGQPGLRVLILYPDGRVSPRQAHQLGSFGGNVRALRVAGSFDDCQRLAKAVLADAGLRAEVPLGSANSISLGRLLPQMAYYAHAALVHWRAHAAPLHLVVPTGNLGNALAALLARRIGLPLGRIVLASNANSVLPEFFAGGDYRPRASLATLANAMDVGAPSNFERLQALYPDPAALRRELTAEAVDDAGIRAAIVRTHARRGQVVCPHTACAAEVLDRLRARGEGGHWAVVATAHPAKFPEVVEPLLEMPVPPPPALAAMLARPAQAEPLANDLAALQALLRAW
ncbi:threonine synthase [Thermomonas flagellata]|uniref:threonine synthase n=1 Tax=Thermomonas flagellata TaxID=2888524 RepID=UPI001F03BCD0|nr:threonine synthase [Thermomonas flagellata]